MVASTICTPANGNDSVAPARSHAAAARWWAYHPPWLVRSRHATAEAGWRTSAAWAEFRDWLRTHPDDRDLYAAAKRRLAVETADDPDSYNLDKNAVIDDIYTRIFSVPPHEHPSWPAEGFVPR